MKINNEGTSKQLKELPNVAEVKAYRLGQGSDIIVGSNKHVTIGFRSSISYTDAVEIAIESRAEGERLINVIASAIEGLDRVGDETKFFNAKDKRI